MAGLAHQIFSHIISGLSEKKLHTTVWLDKNRALRLNAGTASE